MNGGRRCRCATACQVERPPAQTQEGLGERLKHAAEDMVHRAEDALHRVEHGVEGAMHKVQRTAGVSSPNRLPDCPGATFSPPTQWPPLAGRLLVWCCQRWPQTASRWVQDTGQASRPAHPQCGFIAWRRLQVTDAVHERREHAHEEAERGMFTADDIREAADQAAHSRDHWGGGKRTQPRRWARTG